MLADILECAVGGDDLLVFAGGILPAALKKMGTLMNRIQVCGNLR